MGTTCSNAEELEEKEMTEMCSEMKLILENDERIKIECKEYSIIFSSPFI